MAVYLDRPPRSAFLVMWGRAPDAWWGCVQFRQAVRTAVGKEELPVAAWVPAASLRRPNWSSATALPRVVLEGDSARWPAPNGWPSWYAGVWANGPLRLPPGSEAVHGPAWRPGS